MKEYKLMCMSFDGEYVTEGPFKTIDDAWRYSNDMGSRWYFYPFHFVITDKTIADAPWLMDVLIGKRITTVKRLFNRISKKPLTQNMNCDAFGWEIAEALSG